MLVLGILQVRANLLQTRAHHGKGSHSSTTASSCSPPLSPYLDDGSKILAVDGVLCLQVEVPQLTGPHGVVLVIELVKALECLPALEQGDPAQLLPSQFGREQGLTQTTQNGKTRSCRTLTQMLMHTTCVGAPGKAVGVRVAQE